MVAYRLYRIFLSDLTHGAKKTPVGNEKEQKPRCWEDTLPVKSLWCMCDSSMSAWQQQRRAPPNRHKHGDTKHSPVKLCSQHMKRTQTKSTSQQSYSNRSVYSALTDRAPTVLVLLQPIKSWRWRARRPMNASCNWVDMLQFGHFLRCEQVFIHYNGSSDRLYIGYA